MKIHKWSDIKTRWLEKKREDQMALMAIVLDKIIDAGNETPDGKATAVQLAFNNGAALAGALMHDKDAEGIYVMISMFPRQDNKGADPLKVYFTADAVSFVAQPMERPRIETPSGPLIVPPTR